MQSREDASCASYPQPGWPLDAIHTHLVRLPGYQPSIALSPEVRLREVREGA